MQPVQQPGLMRRCRVDPFRPDEGYEEGGADEFVCADEVTKSGRAFWMTPPKNISSAEAMPGRTELINGPIRSL
ncbi:MAG: hypothetical protein EA377_02545 [Phycisphaerales bacterium]|nr:MAG: hypothetical protein EA377_02545 [Phycisphaerales bacterium]